MSAKLSKAQENLYPCEGEALAQFVAAKCSTFSTPIKASEKRTISLLDNKPVCQAAGLLKRGKFSSSKVINNVLVSMAELNLDFQHISGKMGQNFADDFCSRNPAQCKDPSKCKICSFIEECSELGVGNLSFRALENQIIGQIKLKDSGNNYVQDIINGKRRIPFNNRKAMKYLQDLDEDLSRVRELLLAGQSPSPKDKTEVKRYMNVNNNLTIDKDGCMVARKRIRKNLISRELVVLPSQLSVGLVTSMHISLNHPTNYQLGRVVESRFFILDKDKIVRAVSQNCFLCQSVKTIPEEVHEFKPNEMPDHPGKSFTIDVMKLSKKIILVTVENFSSFISTSLCKSEKSEDLLEAVIATTFPLKSSMATIRVDKAPGFRKIFQNKNLEDFGIDITMGEAKNKNALAIVDKKIFELEQEIKKLAPSPNVVNQTILTKATAVVNEKVRAHGMSSKEILFSRDQYTEENLDLKDSDIKHSIMESRVKSNVYSAKSKATVDKKAEAAGAVPGDLVFLKKDGDKHNKRDTYLVMKTDGDYLTICKITNQFSNLPSFQPHNINYQVRQTDIYLAPSQPVKEIYMEEVDDSRTMTWEDENFKTIAPFTEEVSKESEPPEEDDDCGGWTLEFINTEEDQRNQADQELNEEEEPRMRTIEDIEEEDPRSESNENIDEEHELHTIATNNDEYETQEDEGVTPPPEIVQDESRSEQSEENSSTAADSDDESSNDTENEIVDFLQEHPTNPESTPEPGNTITFLDEDTDPATLVTATVKPMVPKMQKKWPTWCNILRRGASRISSVDLSAVRWTFTEEDQDIYQIDGNYTFNSISVEDLYIDENWSDQNSIAGTENSEHMSNLVHLAIATAQFEVSDEPKPERRDYLVDTLNLEVPAPPLPPRHRSTTPPPIPLREYRAQYQGRNRRQQRRWSGNWSRFKSHFSCFQL